MSGLYGFFSLKPLLNEISELPHVLKKSALLEDWERLTTTVEQNFFLGIAAHSPKTAYSRDKVLIAVAGDLIRQNKDAVTDEEYLYERYRDGGINALASLNGSFAVAVFDGNAGTLHLVSDRMCSQPLYYYSNESSFIFGTTIAPALSLGGATPRFNSRMLPLYLKTPERYLVGEQTLFQGVYMVPPATTLTFSQAGLRRSTYWRPSFHQAPKTPPEESALLLKRSLKSSIQAYVGSAKRIGLFLSGGMDSRWLAGCVAELGIPVKAFCFGLKNGLQDTIARKVANRLGIDYHFYESTGDFIRELAPQAVSRGDGSMRIRDCHFLGSLRQLRHEHDLDLVLCGHFGGELFGQMLPSQRAVAWADETTPIPNLISSLRSYTDAAPLSALLTDAVLARLDRDYESLLNEYSSNAPKATSPHQLIDFYEITERSRRYVCQLFRFIDWFLPVKRPFLNNDLMELALSLSSEERIDQSFYRWALCQSFPKLKDIIYEHSFCSLDAPPFELFTRKVLRKGLQFINRATETISAGTFSLRKNSIFLSDYRPYAMWLRQSMTQEFVKNILLDKRCITRDIFRQDFINSVVADHMSGRRDNNVWVCDLLNFELMQRQFFDG